uniref:Uncharacterized protein n=1 Tax=Anguilla anguilla TaxID=7936 RepID=A0A0E9PYP2_ANGAN
MHCLYYYSRHINVNCQSSVKQPHIVNESILII